MAEREPSFVQNNISSHECQFSWIIGYIDPKKRLINKELKIGACKVNWKLAGIAFLNDDNMLAFNIGFYGEKSGSHDGILTFEGLNPFPLRKRTIITLGGDETAIIMLKDGLPVPIISFCGRIKLFKCDCTQKPNEENVLEENITELLNNINNLLKNKQFTDIDIKVDGTCFPVHKLILRARSPVFARMLEHDMKESQENCITVTDTNEKIMGSFVSFLYSGSLEDVSFDTVIGLYSLADKYEVTSLQKSCRRLLFSKISENTVLEILKVSDLHSDEELKQKAAKFISGQFSKIEVCPDWSSLIDSNTRLASYVLRVVSDKLCKL